MYNTVVAVLSVLAALRPRPSVPQVHVPTPERPLPAPVVVRHAPKIAWLAVCTTLVAGFEGLYTHPYHDSVGVLTVCYGATAADHVDLHRTYTPAECKDMLASDLPKYDAEMRRCLTPAAYAALDDHPNRHAALVSFVYNLGPGPICKGAVGHYLNAGNVDAACRAMLAYNHAGGRVLRGLTVRREQEYQLCKRDD